MPGIAERDLRNPQWCIADMLAAVCRGCFAAPAAW